MEICSFSFFSNSYFFMVFSELLLKTDNSREITWLVGNIFMLFYSLVSLKHLSVWHMYKTTFFGDTFKICLESHEKLKLPGKTQICIFCKIYISSEDPVSCISKKSCRTTEQTKRWCMPRLFITSIHTETTIFLLASVMASILVISSYYINLDFPLISNWMHAY